jgi:hypothetical protein
VNYYSNNRTSWKSVGLLVATDVDDARASSNLLSSSNHLSIDSVNDAAQPSAELAGSASALATATSAALAAVPPSLLAPALKYNYVLAASNSNCVLHLQRLGSVVGPAAALLYLDDNITLSKPPVPEAGVLVARPLAMVGLSYVNTSMDLHMTVNIFMLTMPYSNLTLDRIAIENLAPGNAKSAEVAKPLSVSSANKWVTTPTPTAAAAAAAAA